MKNRNLNWVLAGFALLLAGGCSSSSTKAPKDNYAHGEDYVPDETHHDVTKFVDITIANGARADGTLRPVHFTGDQLNSLGEKKLEAMLAADTGSKTTLTVFIDLPKSDPAYAKRDEAVTAFLRTRGLVDTQIAIVDGPNLKYTAPAAQGIKGLDTFNSNDGQFTNSESSGGGSGGSSSGK